MPRRAAWGDPRVLADAAAGAGVWLLLAGSLQWQEVVAALLVGAATGGIGHRVRTEVGHRRAGQAGLLRVWLRTYLGALQDCGVLTRALLRRPVGRPPTGRLCRVPFDVGDRSPAAVGRRVAATLGTSLQPNTYLLGFDHDRGVALVHELVPGDEPIEDELRGVGR